MPSSFIRDVERVPFGRYRNALASVRPDDLSGCQVGELVARHRNINPSTINDVLLGNANAVGEENRNVARMIVILAGFPTSVTGATGNRLCGSGLEAVVQASRAIETGDVKVIIAGGLESMSRAPRAMLEPSRECLTGHETLHSTALRWRMGNPKIPGQWSVSLGETAEDLAECHVISRPELDPAKVNLHRCSTALGHPLGAPGSIVGHLGHALYRHAVRRSGSHLCRSGDRGSCSNAQDNPETGNTGRGRIMGK